MWYCFVEMFESLLNNVWTMVLSGLAIGMCVHFLVAFSTRKKNPLHLSNNTKQDASDDIWNIVKENENRGFYSNEIIDEISPKYPEISKDDLLTLLSFITHFNGMKREETRIGDFYSL